MSLENSDGLRYASVESGDSALLLQGAGRFMRHVKLRPGTVTDAVALCRLIDAAYSDIKARVESG